MEDKKTTYATASLDFTADCPYCGEYQFIDNFDCLEQLPQNELSGYGLEIYHECDSCKNTFIINTIELEY